MSQTSTEVSDRHLAALRDPQGADSHLPAGTRPSPPTRQLLEVSDTVFIFPGLSSRCTNPCINLPPWAQLEGTRGGGLATDPFT